MLKFSHIESDGTVKSDPVPVPIFHPGTGNHAATVWVEIATQSEFDKLVRKCRRHEVDPVSKQMKQYTDGTLLLKACMVRFVRRWEGVCDANGAPLPCVPPVMEALPSWFTDQVIEGVRGVPRDDEPDAEDVRDASFREPA